MYLEAQLLFRIVFYTIYFFKAQNNGQRIEDSLLQWSPSVLFIDLFFCFLSATFLKPKIMTKNRGQSTPMKSLQKEQWMHYLSTSVLLLAFYFFCYRLGNYIQWGSYSLSNWIISVQYLSIINQFTLNISDQVKFEKILQNTKILPKSKTLLQNYSKTDQISNSEVL